MDDQSFQWEIELCKGDIVVKHYIKLQRSLFHHYKMRTSPSHRQYRALLTAEMEPGLRVTGCWVTASAILAGSGRVIGQFVRPVVWPGIDF